ncbi:MAG: hypothetical protein R6X23_07095 [Acidimicrobiia bacterium]
MPPERSRNSGKLIVGFALIGLGLFMGFCVLWVIAFAKAWGMEDDPETYWRAGDTAAVLFVGGLAFIPGVWLVVSGLAHAKRPRQRAGITSFTVGATFFVLSGILAFADTRGGTGGEYLFAVVVGGVPMLLGIALLRPSPPTA